MALRADLLAEVVDVLDGSGDYTGEWIDTGGIQRVRLLNTGLGGVSVTLEHSIDQVNVMPDSWTSGDEKDLTTRYFRFAINGGTPSLGFQLSIRVVS